MTLLGTQAIHDTTKNKAIHDTTRNTGYTWYY